MKIKKVALKFESWNTVFKRLFCGDEKATEKALKWYKSAHNSSSNFSQVQAKLTNQATKQLKCNGRRFFSCFQSWRNVKKPETKILFVSFTINILILILFPFGFLVYWEKNFVACIVLKHPFMKLSRKSRINFQTFLE